MKEEVKKLAASYFEAYPKEDVLHVSEDGQVFLQKNLNDGVNHQRRINPASKLVTVYRKDLNKKPDEGKSESLAPDENWKNKDIEEWLSAAGVNAKGTKKELLAMVAEVIAEEGGSEEKE